MTCFTSSSRCASLREKQRRRGPRIAHFLAHPEIRVKGLATDEARAVFTFLRFRAPLGDLDPKNIPLDLPAAAKLNLERSRSKTVKEAVGISRDKALDILESIIGRMVPNGRGGLEISQLLTGMNLEGVFLHHERSYGRSCFHRR